MYHIISLFYNSIADLLPGQKQDPFGKIRAKFLHNPLLRYACRSLLTGNNGKNNAIAMELCTVFVVSWWRNKGLHTLNRMYNEVWGGAEI